MRLRFIVPLVLIVSVGWVGGLALDEEVIPLPDVLEADARLGTCYSFYDNGLRSTQMYKAGSRWDRFDFRWNVIEDSQGTFNFSGHDTLVDEDLAHGLDVVAILGSTAAWAAPNCSTAQYLSPDRLHGHPIMPQDDLWWRPCPPVGLDLPWNDSQNVWGNFVYQTVQHFKGRVHVWEMWNEPDWKAFWSGSPSQYARLLKVGYLAAKAADPGATVLFAGLAYWIDPTFYQQVLTSLANDSEGAAYNYYFDVSSLHLYSDPYQIYAISGEVMRNVAAKVGPHPLWLTEAGVPVLDEGDAQSLYSLTADQAANYMIEAYAEARAVGVDKFFVFRTHDDAMMPKYGLTRNDYSLRPAYVAYQVAARYLRGENQVTGPFESPVRITFWGTPHGRVDVLWSAAQAPLTYTAVALVPQATLVDWQGITRTLQPSQGYYHISLEPAPIVTSGAQVGGPPQLLIQTDVTSPTSTLSGWELSSNGSVISLTWRVTDTLSGYWYEDIQCTPAEDGPWTTVSSWEKTQGLTQTAVTMPRETILYPVWYFRARARDRVGNWEKWPESAELQVNLPVRKVALSVTAHGDDQKPGLLLSNVAITWTDSLGHVISSTRGVPLSSTLVLPDMPWLVTDTVVVGEYYVDFTHSDYFPARETFIVVAGDGVLHMPITSTLCRVHARLYLPLVVKD